MISPKVGEMMRKDHEKREKKKKLWEVGQVRINEDKICFQNLNSGQMWMLFLV